MPRKCVGIDGNKCIFGSDEKAANPSTGTRCSLCKSTNELKDASASARGAIVRIVVKLTTQQQVEAFKRLKGVPDLLKLVREAIENKQSTKRKEILAQQQRTTSTPPRKEPKAVAPLCILNQGSFAICSHFALATCAAHAFQAKYRMYVSDEALLSIWHQNAIPSKQMWQKQCAAFVSNFRLRSPKSFHNVAIQLRAVRDWNHLCGCVKALGGFRCLLVVSQLCKIFGIHFNDPCCQNIYLKGNVAQHGYENMVIHFVVQLFWRFFCNLLVYGSR